MYMKTDKFKLIQSLSFVVSFPLPNQQSLTFMFVNWHRDQGNQHRWPEKNYFSKFFSFSTIKQLKGTLMA